MTPVSRSDLNRVRELATDAEILLKVEARGAQTFSNGWFDLRERMQRLWTKAELLSRRNFTGSNA